MFVGGAEEKVAAVRGVFPDATFTSWPKVKAALKAGPNLTTESFVKAMESMGASAGPIRAAIRSARRCSAGRMTRW